jgi:aerobic carbon-monoxide dehydrogenase small subunit
MTIRIAMTVNGIEYAREVEPRLLLIHFLRDELGLTGSHWVATRRTAAVAWCG